MAAIEYDESVSGMYDFAGERFLDREELRKRLLRFDDRQLRRFGAAARYMCSPDANMGQPPRPNFVIQLEEAVAEWKRRHGDAQTLNQ